MPLSRPLATYLAGSFLARLADEGVSVAIALLALDRSGSVAGAAAVLTAWRAPNVVAAPLAGTVAARTGRPRALYAGAAGITAAAIAAIGVFLGRAPLPVMIGAAAAGGCCGPLISGGLSSAVPALASSKEPAGPPDHRRAYTLDSAAYNAAALGGPAVVTAAAAVWSAGAAVLLLAASAAAATPLLASLRLSRPPEQAPARAVPATTTFIAGLAAICRDDALRAVTVATCAAYLGMGALPIAAVLTAHRDGGALMTAWALGGLAGSLLLTRWHPAVTAERLAGFCLLGTGGALAAAAASPHIAITGILFALAGGCDGLLLTATLQARARHAPEAVRPEVFTMGAALKLSASAVGAGLIGLAGGAAPRLLLAAVAAAQLLGYAALRALGSRV